MFSNGDQRLLFLQLVEKLLHISFQDNQMIFEMSACHLASRSYGTSISKQKAQNKAKPLQKYLSMAQ